MIDERRHMLRREEDKDGCPYLTADQIDAIAERAAQKALDKVAMNVGKSVISKLLWIAGAASVAFYVWVKDKGIF